MGLSTRTLCGVAAAFFAFSVVASDLPVDSRKLKKRLEAVGTADLNSYSVKRLHGDYQDNEIAADAKYKGKWFVVTGRIGEISKDFMGDPYLVFTADRYGVSMVRADLFADQVCGLSKEKGVVSCSALERAAKLKKGQTIDVECKGGGMVMSIPLLRECLISD